MARFSAPSSRWPKDVGHTPTNSRRIVVVTHMVPRGDFPYDPRFPFPPQEPEEEEEKPGFFGRLFNIFRKSPQKEAPRQNVNHFSDLGMPPGYQSSFPTPAKPTKENSRPAPRRFRTGIPIVDFVLRLRSQQSQPSSPSPQNAPSHFSANDEARIRELREKLYREMDVESGYPEARDDMLYQFNPNNSGRPVEKKGSAKPPSQSSESFWKKLIPRNPTEAELREEEEDDIGDRMPSDISGNQDLAADLEFAVKEFNERAIREGREPLRGEGSSMHHRSRDEEPSWTLEKEQELQMVLENDPEFREQLSNDKYLRERLATLRKEAGVSPPKERDMLSVQTSPKQETEVIDAEFVDPRKPRADSAMRRPLRTDTEWQPPQDRHAPTPKDREASRRRTLSSPHEEEGDSLGHMWSQRLTTDNGPSDRTRETSVSTPSSEPHWDDDNSVPGVMKDYSFEDLPDDTPRGPVDFDRKFGFAESFQDEHIAEGKDDRAWWDSERQRWKKEAETADQDLQTPFDGKITELSVAKVNLEAAKYHRKKVMSEEIDVYRPDRHSPLSKQGAIFRLEGVLVDLTGLHLEAWKSVARYYEFAAPDVRTVREAAVHHPHDAIENVFRWSRIPEKTEEIAAYFQRCLRRATQAWEDVNESWRQTAVGIGKSPPTEQQLENASALSPREMIKQVLKWAKNENDVDDMVAIFSDIAQSNGVAESFMRPKNSAREEPEMPVQFEDPLDVRLNAWITVASMYSLKIPSLGVLSSLDTLSVEDTAQALFESEGLSDKQLGDIAQTYKDALKTIRSSRNGPIAKPLSESQIGQLVAEAWTNVAEKYGKTVPKDESLSLAKFQFPEDVVKRVLKWTDSQQEAEEIADLYRDYINVRRLDLKRDGEVLVVARQSEPYQDDGPIPFVTVHRPTAEWISKLKRLEVECGLVSYMSPNEMEKFVRFANLEEVFPPGTRVSAFSTSEHDSHHLLEAALYIHRRPDHCILFDSTPHASSLAHELGMKSVSVSGNVPHHELNGSDMVVDRLEGVPFINLRALCSEKDEPETEAVLQRVDKPNDGNNKRNPDWDDPMQRSGWDDPIQEDPDNNYWR